MNWNEAAGILEQVTKNIMDLCKLDRLILYNSRLKDNEFLWFFAFFKLMCWKFKISSIAYNGCYT